MNTEVLKIIEGALQKDQLKVLKYARQLAANESAKGNTKFAMRIEECISQKSGRFVAPEEMMSLPVDSDSRLEMVSIVRPTGDKTDLVLSPRNKEKIDNFVKFVQKRDEIEKHNIPLNQSLLLYGPPGCGKTTLAKQIAAKLNLPLTIIRLDSTISSLLGSTAKNLSRIFSHARQHSSILFLDEFDSIAKARNDQNELGELKRVVNSLIQNIDEYSDGGILIAATNHEELLDKGIWRRFSNHIHLGLPSVESRLEMLKIFLKDYPNDVLDNSKRLTRIGELLEGSSPAEIRNICHLSIQYCIVNNSPKLNYAQLLSILFNNSKAAIGDDSDLLIKFLNENLVPQENIGELLDISMRQVRRTLSAV